MFVKWKLQIDMKLLGKNGIRIEIEFFFRMEITLHGTTHEGTLVVRTHC